jgi:hypothetical protein
VTLRKRREGVPQVRARERLVVHDEHLILSEVASQPIAGRSLPRSASAAASTRAASPYSKARRSRVPRRPSRRDWRRTEMHGLHTNAGGSGVTATSIVEMSSDIRGRGDALTSSCRRRRTGEGLCRGRRVNGDAEPFDSAAPRRRIHGRTAAPRRWCPSFWLAVMACLLRASARWRRCTRWSCGPPGDGAIRNAARAGRGCLTRCCSSSIAGSALGCRHAGLRARALAYGHSA